MEHANGETGGARGGSSSGGFRGWMRRVPELCDRAEAGFEPKTVHDLRVALRRCESVADAVGAIDPDEDWRALKRISKPLFRDLGELRDAQVIGEWALRLGAPEDPLRIALLAEALSREERLDVRLHASIADFSRKRWKALSRKLPRRLDLLEHDGPVFDTLALERWTEAHALHEEALARRSRVAWHRLRIGIKHFRYVVENFLASRHSAWSGDLKRLQDLLGEVHDLDLLAGALQRLRHPREDKERWRKVLDAERWRRLAEYRDSTNGHDSLWDRWRSGLPEGEDLHAASLERLGAWASFLDPEPNSARSLRRLVRDLATGLARLGIGEALRDPSAVRLLEAAALLRSVPESRALVPPPGWTSREMSVVALLVSSSGNARQHSRHVDSRELPDSERRRTAELLAVLRLATALSPRSERSVVRARVARLDETVLIRTTGYVESPESTSRVAAAKYVLERVTGRRFMVRPHTPSPRLTLASPSRGQRRR